VRALRQIRAIVRANEAERGRCIVIDEALALLRVLVVVMWAAVFITVAAVGAHG
jgi:hypothetical protein